jgi:predicted transposase/invertase (TIGR01784 family)
VQLKNQKNQIFSDKLHYIYIEMPKFNKKIDEVNSHLEKWIYFLKHLNDFEKIPELFKNERIFLNAFEKAEIANFTPEEFAIYQASIKIERDLNSAFATAVAQGRADGLAAGRVEGRTEGRTEGRAEESKAIAKNLKNEGVDIAFIAKMTGLTEEEIRKL